MFGFGAVIYTLLLVTRRRRHRHGKTRPAGSRRGRRNHRVSCERHGSCGSLAGIGSQRRGRRGRRRATAAAPPPPPPPGAQPIIP